MYDKKDDSVDQSLEDNAEARLTDEHDSNAVTSHNVDNSDSTEDKNREYTESEQGTRHMSDGNSSQVIPSKDSNTGERSKETSVEEKKTEIGCVRDGGTDKK